MGEIVSFVINTKLLSHPSSSLSDLHQGVLVKVSFTVGNFLGCCVS